MESLKQKEKRKCYTLEVAGAKKLGVIVIIVNVLRLELVAVICVNVLIVKTSKLS